MTDLIQQNLPRNGGQGHFLQKCRKLCGFAAVLAAIFVFGVAFVACDSETIAGKDDGGTEQTGDSGDNGGSSGTSGQTDSGANAVAGDYSIIYNLNGGSIEDEAPVSYSADNLVCLPVNVTKTGYTFAGWYADSGFLGSKIIEIPQGSTGSKTFWAKWTAMSFTVNFDSNGGSTPYITSKAVFYDGVYGELPGVSRDGYGFVGWFTAVSDGIQVTSSTTVNITEDQTLYARWSNAVIFSITYNLNGGSSGTESGSYTCEMEITLPTDAGRVGYDFAGWYDNSALNGWAVSTIPQGSTGNREFWAKWTPKYTVTFNLNGADLGTSSEQTVVAGESVTLRKDIYIYIYIYNYGTYTSFRKYGYSFDGWQVNGSGKVYKGGESYTPTASVTLYAKWTLMTGPFTDIYDMKAWLSLQSNNTPSTPYTVKFNGYAEFDAGTYHGSINYTVTNAGRYVVLDLRDYDGFNYSILEGGSLSSSYSSSAWINHIISNNQYIKGLILPTTLTFIGSCAFYECSNLTSVVISDLVTGIGGWAFAGCTGLTSITIPDSVTYIGDDAFSGCTGLKSITIGNSVTSIGYSYYGGYYDTVYNAFYVCSNLTQINVDAGNPTYSSENGVLFNKGKTTLIFCPHGKTSVTIPNSVTSIGENAFSGCTGLTSITIPNLVASIGDLAFYVCSNLTQINVDAGNTAYSSENGVLFNKGKTTLILCPYGKTSVTIPNSVTSIKNFAFDDDTGLTSVTFARSGIGIYNCFPGDLYTKYNIGGAGTYTRASGGTTWTKQ